MTQTFTSFSARKNYDQDYDFDFETMIGRRDGKLVVLEKKEAYPEFDPEKHVQDAVKYSCVDAEPRHAGAFTQPTAIDPLDSRRRDFIEKEAGKAMCAYLSSPCSAGMHSEELTKLCVGCAVALWNVLQKEFSDESK